jgi:carboxypeptidase C (cathepsin A)
MIKNPDLRLFVASGYYDLATPFAATEYTVDHLVQEPALGDRFTMTYYDAGHMMYIHQQSLEKLKRDAGKFFAAAVPRT